MLGTRVAENHLGQRSCAPHLQAAHMIASDPIKPLLGHLARRRPSTYACPKCIIQFITDNFVLWEMTIDARAGVDAGEVNCNHHHGTALKPSFGIWPRSVMIFA
jgi:hypothetical protein